MVSTRAKEFAEKQARCLQASTLADGKGVDCLPRPGNDTKLRARGRCRIRLEDGGHYRRLSSYLAGQTDRIWNDVTRL